MENSKPTGTGTTKFISEHIEAAKAKGHEVIVIGAGDSGKAELTALMARIDDIKDAVIIIEDINKIFEEKKNPAFERPSIPIINTHEPLPVIETRKKPYQEKHFAGFSKRRKK